MTAIKAETRHKKERGGRHLGENRSKKADREVIKRCESML